MRTPEEQKQWAMIDSVVRPLSSRIDHLEKEVRRLKSEQQSTKSEIARLRRR